MSDRNAALHEAIEAIKKLIKEAEPYRIHEPEYMGGLERALEAVKALLR